MTAALLPPSASALERAAAEVFAQRARLPVRIGDLWNPDVCPAEQLPWLAWARSVDRWFPDWSEAQRRRAIAASHDVHRHKGTAHALKGALSVLGGQTEVVEWFQASPPGAPYTFSVEHTPELPPQPAIDDAWFERIAAIVRAAKNTRSHLVMTRVVLDSRLHARARVGAATLTAQTLHLYPPPPATMTAAARGATALAHMTHHTITLRVETQP